MDCQIHRADDIADMVLIGSLDSSWSSYLADRMDEVLRAGALEVRVDMAAVTYLSSNGIALLVRYHRQLRRIGGRLRIVADSEAVSHVLRLSGVERFLHEDEPLPATQTDRPRKLLTVEREGMVLVVYTKATPTRTERLELIGDPTRLAEGRGYDASSERAWTAAPHTAAVGLGALGPNFQACRDRFGEFMAAGGIAAYRPSVGSGSPDFEQTAGTFQPTVRMLYGLAFPIEAAWVVRFEAKGEPGRASVRLSQIAAALLDQTQSDHLGVVFVAETDGLVGAALTRSPVGLEPGFDLFAHPEARQWLSLTPEPEHARSTVLVVGVATRNPGPELAPFVRPLAAPAEGAGHVLGHFHAAVVPYRPLAGGAIDLTATVSQIFEPGVITSLLHLVGDMRPIIGAGESTFTRGAIWFVPVKSTSTSTSTSTASPVAEVP